MLYVPVHDHSDVEVSAVAMIETFMTNNEKAMLQVVVNEDKESAILVNSYFLSRASAK